MTRTTPGRQQAGQVGWARRRAMAALAAGLVVALGGSTAWAMGETGPRVIVEVEGDAANGFGIHYDDGSAIFPPTDSEAKAECGEYDTLRARVRCRTEVRTWYRDLADLQRSLAWAAEH
jgi:hypothetical protein